MTDALKNHIEQLAIQLSYTKEGLLDLFVKTANAMYDKDFISQVINIDEHIGKISADN